MKTINPINPANRLPVLYALLGLPTSIVRVERTAKRMLLSCEKAVLLTGRGQ